MTTTSDTHHEPDPGTGSRQQTARDSDGRLPADSTVRHLSQMARQLQAEPDMAALLDRIVVTAVDEIDGADHGGITLLQNGAVHAVAATHPVVEHLDQCQNELGEGPCLNSLHEQITVRSDDFDVETRWPQFVSSAREQGVRSMLSVQLFVEGDNLGALNLYAKHANVFDRDDEYVAMAMAAHAAIAMKGSRIQSNLLAAVASRDVIGQAKGILMERHKVDAAEAFRLLVVASQDSNRKVRDVADELASTGNLPSS